MYKNIFLIFTLMLSGCSSQHSMDRVTQQDKQADVINLNEDILVSDDVDALSNILLKYPDSHQAEEIKHRLIHIYRQQNSASGYRNAYKWSSDEADLHAALKLLDTESGLAFFIKECIKDKDIKMANLASVKLLVMYRVNPVLISEGKLIDANYDADASKARIMDHDIVSIVSGEKEMIDSIDRLFDSNLIDNAYLHRGGLDYFSYAYSYFLLLQELSESESKLSELENIQLALVIRIFLNSNLLNGKYSPIETELEIVPMVVNFYIRRDDEIRKEQARREIKEKQFELAFLIGAGLVKHSINSMRQTLGEINSHNEAQRTISRNKGPWFLKELSYCSDAYSGNMHSYFCDTVCTNANGDTVKLQSISAHNFENTGWSGSDASGTFGSTLQYYQKVCSSL
ncbi:hypothetical protein [Shewanella xiamenensis]|uniref:hypothetical protein n=1 Tax=Shewanella xiamenensis TaxID=332186 RepID=UPI0035B88B0D